MTIDPVVIDKRPRSLLHMFRQRVEDTPDEDAFYYPVEGGWQESSWGHTNDLVVGLAAGLLALEVEPEDRVAIDRVDPVRVGARVSRDPLDGCGGHRGRPDR